ncbi:FkbM family methyltransferase [Magnetovirga frankeli]|uniref:FkbM family methyltransferase n=1 Tax=Magnetovirga frankeli TaxID=947516 RepID=UPI00129401C6|nr:FkbM family methyltransferase [gamma proteobacterium SS-5]
MTRYYAEREFEIFNKQAEILSSLAIYNPIVFDVGANEGQSIEKYHQLCTSATIYSFEPNPLAWDKLQESYGHNSKVKLFKKGLNEQSGLCSFFVTRELSASSLFQPEVKLQRLSKDRKYDFEEIKVDCITLDKFSIMFGIDQIDILKIDVQGAELNVLKGACNLLSRGSISVIFLEITFAETYVNQMQLIDLLSFIEQHNYKIWDLAPFVYTRTGRLWAANAIILSRDAYNKIEST